MYDDWNTDLTGIDAGNKGYPANGDTYPETFRQQVTMLTAAGIHVGAHAVGDRGIDFVVDTFAEALKRMKGGLRHSIIHANVPTDRAMHLMASLQKTYDAGYPEAQAPSSGGSATPTRGTSGPKANPRLEPFAFYAKNGVIWGGGSDYSVTPYPARYGLWASVARETQAGTYGKTPFGSGESIDIACRRSSPTRSGRPTSCSSNRRSVHSRWASRPTLPCGSQLQVPAAQLKDLRCEMTLVAGALVFERK